MAVRDESAAARCHRPWRRTARSGRRRDRPAARAVRVSVTEAVRPGQLLYARDQNTDRTLGLPLTLVFDGGLLGVASLLTFVTLAALDLGSVISAHAADGELEPPATR